MLVVALGERAFNIAQLFITFTNVFTASTSMIEILRQQKRADTFRSTRGDPARGSNYTT